MTDHAEENPARAPTKPLRPARPLKLVKSPAAAPARPPCEAGIFFNRLELDAILAVYGRKVVEGEWRDYAIGASKDAVVFAVFRRASEIPLYHIEKRPKLARRQGAYSIVSQSGLVLKRGHDLAQVLKFFERRTLRLVDG